MDDKKCTLLMAFSIYAATAERDQFNEITFIAFIRAHTHTQDLHNTFSLRRIIFKLSAREFLPILAFRVEWSLKIFLWCCSALLISSRSGEDSLISDGGMSPFRDGGVGGKKPSEWWWCDSEALLIQRICVVINCGNNSGKERRRNYEN